MWEIVILLVTAIVPIVLIFPVICLAVRLAIRHEHRNHPER